MSILFFNPKKQYIFECNVVAIADVSLATIMGQRLMWLAVTVWRSLLSRCFVIDLGRLYIHGTDCIMATTASI